MLRIWIQDESQLIRFCMYHATKLVDDPTCDGWCFDIPDSLLILRWLRDNIPMTVVKIGFNHFEFIGDYYAERTQTPQKVN